MNSIVTLNEINPGELVEVVSDAGGIDGSPFTREVVSVDGSSVSITDGDETWGISLDMANYDTTVKLKTGNLCHVFHK